jgi:hypothetical protein
MKVNITHSTSIVKCGWGVELFEEVAMVIEAHWSMRPSQSDEY